jgi:hypothetical protein
LNDRRGERESLGRGGEKRYSATGGSAKGIPEIEGLRSNRIIIIKGMTSKKVDIRGPKTLSSEDCASEIQAGLAIVPGV